MNAFNSLVGIKETKFGKVFPGGMPVSFNRSHLKLLKKNHTNYMVTPKSDGERIFLYVSEDGTIWIVYRNMKSRKLTNLTPELKKMFPIVLDGEWLPTDNTFLPFDALYVGGKSIEDKDYYKRLQILTKLVVDILQKQSTPGVTFSMKKFISCKASDCDIFQKVSSLLEAEKAQQQEGGPPNDGLVFTPIYHKYVRGSWSEDRPGVTLPLLKWKPPNENTIDFRIVRDSRSGKTNWFYLLCSEGKEEKRWSSTYLPSTSAGRRATSVCQEGKVCECMYYTGCLVPSAAEGSRQDLEERHTKKVGLKETIQYSRDVPDLNRSSPNSNDGGNPDTQHTPCVLKMRRTNRLDDFYNKRIVEFYDTDDKLVFSNPMVELYEDAYNNHESSSLVECYWRPGRFIPYRSRSEKGNPNSRKVVDDTFDIIKNPVTEDILRTGVIPPAKVTRGAVNSQPKKKPAELSGLFTNFSKFEEIFNDTVLTTFMSELDELPEGQGLVELECRFGDLLSDRFRTGISKKEYNFIKDRMDDDYNKDSKGSSKTVDTIYMDGYRKTEDGKTETFIKKTKKQLTTGKLNLDVSHFSENTQFKDVRFSVSLEEKQKGKEKLSEPKVIRKKDRDTYYGKDVQIDLTEVTVPLTGETTYELEIEVITDRARSTNEDDIESFLEELPREMFETITYLINLLEQAPTTKVAGDKTIGFKSSTSARGKPKESYTKIAIGQSTGAYGGKTMPHQMRNTRTTLQILRDKVHKDIIQIIDNPELKLGEKKGNIRDLAHSYIDDMISTERTTNKNGSSSEQRKKPDGVIKGRSMRWAIVGSVYWAMQYHGISISQKKLSEITGDNYSSVKTGILFVQKIIDSPKQIHKFDAQHYVQQLVVKVKELQPYEKNMTIIVNKYEAVKNKVRCNASPIVILGAVVIKYFGAEPNEVYKVLFDNVGRKKNPGKAFDECIKAMDETTQRRSRMGAETDDEFTPSSYSISTMTITGGTKDTKFKKLKPSDRVMVSGKFTKGHIKYMLEDLKVLHAKKMLSALSAKLAASISNEYQAATLKESLGLCVDELDVMNKINLDKLYENMTLNSKFVSIVTKDSGSDETENRKKKHFDDRDASEQAEAFQNRAQIVMKYGDKQYDIKLFPQGRFNITGCKDYKICTNVARDLIEMINGVPGAVTESEYSTFKGETVQLDVDELSKLKISNINANWETNVVFKTNAQNTIGLMGLKKVLLKEEYAHILVGKKHPKLKSDQMQISLAAPNTRTGKRLIVKFESDKKVKIPIDRKGGYVERGNIITIQVHSNGSINLSASSESDVEKGYQWMNHILKENFDELHDSTVKKNRSTKVKSRKVNGELICAPPKPFLDYNAKYKLACFSKQQRCSKQRQPVEGKCPSKFPRGPFDNKSGQKCCYR